MNEKELREMLHRTVANLKHCCEQINAFRFMENTKLENTFEYKLNVESRLLEDMGFTVNFGVNHDDADGKIYYSSIKVEHGTNGYCVIF